MGSAVIINSPGLFGRQATLEAKTEEISKLNQADAKARLKNLSEQDFYSYMQLVQLIAAAQTKMKKTTITQNGVSQEFSSVESIEKIEDISVFQKILEFTEEVSGKLQEGTADAVFEYFNLTPEHLIKIFKTYPGFSQKLSQKMLQEYAESSSDVAKYILSTPALAKIIDENQHGRYQIYLKHDQHLLLGHAVLNLSNVLIEKFVYKEDSTLPKDIQELNKLYKDIVDKTKQIKSLTADIDALQVRKEKLKSLQVSIAIRDKEDNAENRKAVGDFVDKLKSELGLSDEGQISSQMDSVKDDIEKKRAELKGVKSEKNKDLDKLRKITQGAKKQIIGEYALDHFLLNQDADQARVNMFDLISIYPNYVTLLRERHIQKMFELVNDKEEFLQLADYLFSAFQESAGVEAHVKSVFSKATDGSNIKKYRKWLFNDFASRPAITKALYQNETHAFADEIFSISNSYEKIKPVLESNHWLTALHLVELNSKISSNSDRKQWQKYLQGKNKPIEKLIRWAETEMRNVSGPDKKVVEFLRDNPDVRGWMALGKKPGLMQKWIANTKHDLDVCRLVSIDDHLWESYRRSSVPQVAESEQLYLKARHEFGQKVNFRFYKKDATVLFEHINSTDFSQETAFIIAEKYFEKIRPVQGLFEATATFQSRVTNLINKSPFFKAKLECESLANLALDSKNKDYFDAFLQLSNDTLLVDEIIRSAEGNLSDLIKLANLYTKVKARVLPTIIGRITELTNLSPVEEIFVRKCCAEFSISQLVALAKYPALKEDVDAALKDKLLLGDNVAAADADYLNQHVLYQFKLAELVTLYRRNNLLKVKARECIVLALAVNAVGHPHENVFLDVLRSSDTVISADKAAYFEGLLTQLRASELVVVAQKHASLKDKADAVLLNKLAAVADVADAEYVKNILTLGSIEQLIAIAQKHPSLASDANRVLLVRLVNAKDPLTDAQQIGYLSETLDSASTKQLIEIARNDKLIIFNSERDISNPFKAYADNLLMMRLSAEDAAAIDSDEYLKDILDVAKIEQLVAIAQKHPVLKSKTDVVLLDKLTRANANEVTEKMAEYVRNILAGGTDTQLVAIASAHPLLKLKADSILVDLMITTELTENLDYFKSLLPLASIDQLKPIVRVQKKIAATAVAVLVEKLDAVAKDKSDVWVDFARDEYDLFVQVPNYLSRAVTLLRHADAEKVKAIFAKNPALGVELLDKKESELTAADITRLAEVNNTQINKKLGANARFVIKLLENNFDVYHKIMSFKSKIVEIIHNISDYNVQDKILIGFLNSKTFLDDFLHTCGENPSVLAKLISSPEISGQDLVVLWNSGKSEIVVKLKEKLAQDEELLIRFMNAPNNDGSILSDKTFNSKFSHIFTQEDSAKKLEVTALNLIQKSNNRAVKGALDDAADEFSWLKERLPSASQVTMHLPNLPQTHTVMTSSPKSPLPAAAIQSQSPTQQQFQAQGLTGAIPTPPPPPPAPPIVDGALVSPPPPSGQQVQPRQEIAVTNKAPSTTSELVNRPSSTLAAQVEEPISASSLTSGRRSLKSAQARKISEKPKDPVRKIFTLGDLVNSESFQKTLGIKPLATNAKVTQQHKDQPGFAHERCLQDFVKYIQRDTEKPAEDKLKSLNIFKDYLKEKYVAFLQEYIQKLKARTSQSGSEALAKSASEASTELNKLKEGPSFEIIEKHVAPALYEKMKPVRAKSSAQTSVRVEVPPQVTPPQPLPRDEAIKPNPLPRETATKESLQQQTQTEMIKPADQTSVTNHGKEEEDAPPPPPRPSVNNEEQKPSSTRKMMTGLAPLSPASDNNQAQQMQKEAAAVPPVPPPLPLVDNTQPAASTLPSLSPERMALLAKLREGVSLKQVEEKDKTNNELKDLSKDGELTQAQLLVKALDARRKFIRTPKEEEHDDENDNNPEWNP